MSDQKKVFGHFVYLPTPSVGSATSVRYLKIERAGKVVQETVPSHVQRVFFTAGEGDVVKLTTGCHPVKNGPIRWSDTDTVTGGLPVLSGRGQKWVTKMTADEWSPATAPIEHAGNRAAEPSDELEAQQEEPPVTTTIPPEDVAFIGGEHLGPVVELPPDSIVSEVQDPVEDEESESSNDEDIEDPTDTEFLAG